MEACSCSSMAMLSWLNPTVTALASQLTQLLGSRLRSGPASVIASAVLTVDR